TRSKRDWSADVCSSDLQEYEEDYEELPEDAEATFLKVDGMPCATCESFIASLSKEQEGIYRSEASYSSELVKIYYNPDQLAEDELPDLISKMGYDAYPMNSFFGGDNFTQMMRLTLGTIFAVYGLLVYIMVLYPTYLTGQPLIPFSKTAIYFFMYHL